MPFDSASIATIAAAAACLAAAAILRQRLWLRVALVCVAAFMVRLDPSVQWSLHAWDERLHALVAKHMIAHPLTPTLYEHPVLPADPRHWTENHVWLHKPPLTMWLMAASMAAFGVNAIAMRLPSVLLSALGVLLVFLVGRKLFSARVGVLAAGLQAVNGLLVSLASGRRVADHVDTVLLACVQLGAAIVVTSSPSESRARVPVLAGMAMGAGLLAKSAPALLVAVLAAVMWIDWRAKATSARRLLWLFAGAAGVAGPWMIYAAVRFPAETAAGVEIIRLHMTTVLDGAGGPWWMFVKDMPRYFGELVFIPVIWFVAHVARGTPRRADWAILAWLITPYAVFSVMPTKLPGFIAIAAPALFLVQAVFWCRLRDALPGLRGATRVATAALLVLLVLLPARGVLEPQGPFERRDRWPAFSRQMMQLEAELGAGDAVIFNMPRALEAMFYSRFTAYVRMPRPEEVEALQRRQVPIVIFVPAGAAPPPVPETWGARLLHEARDH